LESQRVKFLIKGYLRGWLPFDYSQKTSRLRENVILHFLEESDYEEMLRDKLLMDASLIGGSQNKTSGMLQALDKTYRLILGLKLPDVAAQSKINSTDRSMSKEQIDQWKQLLKQGQEKINKYKDNKKS
jgi:hypothetical protein